MKILTMIVAKTISFILKKMGRGSAFPGEIALKLNQNIFKHFKLPKTTIFITGTTGKTSIAGILNNIYEQSGYKVGINNKGSNLDTGVLTCLINNANIFGKIKSDVLVLEVDERYVKKTIQDIKPNFFIINNLSRDQLARNGHPDIVWKDINEYITDDIHLILNADDPTVVKFALNHKGLVTYYGLKETSLSIKENKIFNLDTAYCPICNNKLKFDYFHYGNLGDYKCSKCDFKRPITKFEAELIDNDHFKIDDITIKMNNTALYNVYNLSASYAVSITDGVDKDKVGKAINNLSLKIKRFDTFIIDDKKCTLLLSKNETPISYNQSLEYISKQNHKKTVVIGFKNVSGRYNLKDLSWLWDINFELLNDDNVENIICLGNFAYDIAVRLKNSKIPKEKIITYTDPNVVIDAIKQHGNEFVYCVFYFDLEKIFKNSIEGV